MSIARAWCLVLVTLVVAGCGNRARITPVSGVVTLDGKPLANAHVAFQPEAKSGIQTGGAGSYGMTDSNGAYSLRMTDTDEAGAVVSKHRVAINYVTQSDDSDPAKRPPPKKLPTKYNENSELTFDVVAGKANQANFDLKSK